MKLKSILFILFVIINKITTETVPEQIHLSYGPRPSQMVITWTTLEYTNQSYVKYGIEELDYLAIGTTKEFKNDEKSKRITWVHSVMVSDLTPGQKYSWLTKIN